MKEEKKNTDYKSVEEISQDGLYKIGVTREAEKVLAEVVNQVNDGYQGGRASRTGVASWIITQFGKAVDTHVIKAMRLEFLNELSLLEMVLRKSKETGQLAPELKKLLMQQAGLLEEPARRTPKSKALEEMPHEPKKDSA